MSQTELSDWLFSSLVINYLLVLIWFALFWLGKERIKAFHSRWFRLTETDFERLHYTGMMVYKILIMMFNLAPWLALKILA